PGGPAALGVAGSGDRSIEDRDRADAAAPVAGIRDDDGDSAAREDLSSQIDEDARAARVFGSGRGAIERITLTPRSLVDSCPGMPARGSPANGVDGDPVRPDCLERPCDLVPSRNPAGSTQIPGAHERRDGGIKGSAGARRPRLDLREEG